MRATIILIVLALVFQAQKCDKNKSAGKEFTDFGACYDERTTESTVLDAPGSIVKINEELWAIVPDSKPNFRYAICVIPEELKKEGMKVTFSGEVKKIEPAERMAAHPFKITKLTVQE